MVSGCSSGARRRRRRCASPECPSPGVRTVRMRVARRHPVTRPDAGLQVRASTPSDRCRNPRRPHGWGAARSFACRRPLLDMEPTPAGSDRGGRTRRRRPNRRCPWQPRRGDRPVRPTRLPTSSRREPVSCQPPARSSSQDLSRDGRSSGRSTTAPGRPPRHRTHVLPLDGWRRAASPGGTSAGRATNVPRADEA